MTTRNELIDRLKSSLDQLNEQMDDLEAKALKASGDAKAKIEQRKEELKVMAQPALTKLEELTAAGEDGWKQLEAETERVYKAFKHSFNYFKSQLRKPD